MIDNALLVSGLDLVDLSFELFEGQTLHPIRKVLRHHNDLLLDFSYVDSPVKILLPDLVNRSLVGLKTHITNLFTCAAGLASCVSEPCFGSYVDDLAIGLRAGVLSE